MLVYARMRRSLNTLDDSTTSKESTIMQDTGARGLHPDAQQEMQLNYSTEAPSYTVISMASSHSQNASQMYSSDSSSRVPYT